MKIKRTVKEFHTANSTPRMSTKKEETPNHIHIKKNCINKYLARNNGMKKTYYPYLNNRFSNTFINTFLRSEFCQNLIKLIGF